MRSPLFTCILLTVLAAAACGGDGSPSAPSTASTSTSSGSTAGRTSHNAGRDCTICHSFTLAGTAYRSDGATVYAGATIKVTSLANGGGTALATLTSDASGNFYASTPVAFGSGVYVSATGTTGVTRAMTGAITSGACNRCHTSASRLIVD
jgi:hypothetical protein